MSWNSFFLRFQSQVEYRWKGLKVAQTDPSHHFYLQFPSTVQIALFRVHGSASDTIHRGPKLNQTPGQTPSDCHCRYDTAAYDVPHITHTHTHTHTDKFLTKHGSTSRNFSTFILVLFGRERFSDEHPNSAILSAAVEMAGGRRLCTIVGKLLDWNFDIYNREPGIESNC